MSLGSSSTRRRAWVLVPLMGRLAFFDGKFDPESTPLAHFRLDSHSTAHPFHRLPHDGEPDAGAGIGFLFVKPLEDPEDALQVLRRDADSVVFDPEPHPRISHFTPYFDPRLRTGGDELRGIRKQIRQHPSE